MLRPTAALRLANITGAANASFGRLGYLRTHMADVAAEAGISSGSIYNYVESKEALFHLVIATGFGLLEDLPNLPLPTPRFESTLCMIDAGLRRNSTTPILSAALEIDDPANPVAELDAVINELYEMMRSLSRVLPAIEKCAIDLPDLDKMYFGRGRPQLINHLSKYVTKRSKSGHFVESPDVAITTQIILEIVAWFTWKRFKGHDANRFDDQLSRQTVIEFVRHALIRQR